MSRRRGQIIPRGEGVWVVRFYLGRNPLTKKRRYVNKTVRGTKRDAERVLTKDLGLLDQGHSVEPSRKALGSYLVEWLQTTAKARLRPRTLRDYTQRLNVYVLKNEDLAAIPLSKVREAELQRLYNSLTERGLSPRSVRYLNAILHSAFRKAMQAGMIHRNPTEFIDLPREVRKEMTALSVSETKKFIEASKGDQFEALWLLLVTCGLRPSEATALKWEDWDKKTTLMVRRALVPGPNGKGWSLDEPKTKKSERMVVLFDFAAEALRRHRIEQNKEKLTLGSEYEDKSFIFATATGEPLQIRNYVRGHFWRILEKAELPRIRMYDLRHTAATFLLANNVNPKVVADRLGHSTTRLTLDTYSHVLPGMQEEAVSALGRLLSADSA